MALLTHRFKYLITGYGHSGTGCVYKALNSVGVLCTHEGVRKGKYEVAHGANEHPLSAIVADSNHYMTLPGNLDLPYFEKATIIHLVREPVLVLRSWLDMAASQGAEIDAERINRLAADYVSRNLYAENGCGSRPYYRIRIEDGPARLMEIIGKPGETPAFWNAGYNKHYSGTLQLTWGDLPKSDEVGRLRAMATRYGYLCTL